MLKPTLLLRFIFISFSVLLSLVLNSGCTKGSIQNSSMNLELSGIEVKEPALGILKTRDFPTTLNIKGTCNTNISGFQISKDGSSFSDLNEANFGISSEKTSCESLKTFGLSINNLKEFLASLEISSPADGKLGSGSEIVFYLKVFDIRSTSPAFKITIVGSYAIVGIASGLGPNPTIPNIIGHLDISLSNTADGDQYSFYSDAACSVPYNSTTQVNITSNASSATFDFINSGDYKIYIKVVDSSSRLIQCTELFTYNYQNPVDPAPYGLLAQAISANTLRISWSPGSVPQGKTPYFTIEQSQTNGSPFANPTTYCTGFVSNSCDIDGLDSTTDFFYRVKSDIGGQIYYSSVFKFRSIGSFSPSSIAGAFDPNNNINWTWTWPNGGSVATASYSMDGGNSWITQDTWRGLTTASFLFTNPLPRFSYLLKLQISNPTLTATEMVFQSPSAVTTPYLGDLETDPMFTGFTQGKLVFLNNLTSSTAAIRAIDISNAANSYKIYLAGETQDATGGRNGLLKALNVDGSIISDTLFANNSSAAGYDSALATSSPDKIDTAAAPTTSATKISRSIITVSVTPINETFSSLLWLGGSSLMVGGGDISDITGNLWGFESGKPSSGYWDSSLVSDSDFGLGFVNTSLKSQGAYYDIKMAYDRANNVIYLCPKSQGPASNIFVSKLEISPGTGRFVKTASNLLFPADSLSGQTRDCVIHENRLYLIAWLTNNTTINRIVVYKFEPTLSLDSTFNSTSTPGSISHNMNTYIPTINTAQVVGNSTKALVIGGSVSNAGQDTPTLFSVLLTNTPSFGFTKYNGSVGQITGMAIDPLDPDFFYPVGYVRGISPTTDHMSVWSVRWNGSSLDRANGDAKFAINGLNQILVNTSTSATGYEGHDRAYTIKIHPVNHMMYIGGQSELSSEKYSPILWLVH